MLSLGLTPLPKPENFLLGIFIVLRVNYIKFVPCLLGTFHDLPNPLLPKLTDPGLGMLHALYPTFPL